MTNDKFEKEGKQLEWFEFIKKYNDKITNIDFNEIEKKYGNDYSNKHTRRALNVMRKFLQNMLTSIMVRDCYFNILGRCNGEFDKYRQFKVECIN